MQAKGYRRAQCNALSAFELDRQAHRKSVVARASTLKSPRMKDLSIPNIANIKDMGALKDLGMDTKGDLKDLTIRDVKVGHSSITCIY